MAREIDDLLQSTQAKLHHIQMRLLTAALRGGMTSVVREEVGDFAMSIAQDMELSRRETGDGYGT